MNNLIGLILLFGFLLTLFLIACKDKNSDEINKTEELPIVKKEPKKKERTQNEIIADHIILNYQNISWNVHSTSHMEGRYCYENIQYRIQLTNYFRGNG